MYEDGSHMLKKEFLTTDYLHVRSREVLIKLEMKLSLTLSE